MIQKSETALLDELMEPLGRCLTPEVARQIVQLRASPTLEARVREFAEKSNEGVLSAEERLQYETIVRFTKFVSVLQSKARTLLQNDLPE